MLKQRSSKTNRFVANRRQHIQVEGSSHALLEQYPTRVNFYSKPPLHELSIEEFETFALDRLQVLKTLETAALRNKNGPDYKRQIEAALEKHLPLKSNNSRSSNLYGERRKDHISHYVLRLAYCRSEDLRSWFLRQECALFKYRFEQQSIEEKKQFVAGLNLSWSIVEQSEKEQLMEKLAACVSWKVKSGQMAREHVMNETYFKVNFEKVPDLISRRNVYVAQGKAYVPMSAQVSIVMDEFKARLSAALEATYKAIPRMEEDERLKPILLNVEKQYIGKDYGSAVTGDGDIRASDVDALVRQHAPLCMSHLHSSLRADRHLKHGGRMQYGLFLKAIGLSVEEALVFWRTSFSNITDDKFQKEYAYNIRHNYGLEGGRINYKPYNCMKIITGNPPSSGDHHGCPFRHFSHHNLETKLHADRIGQAHVTEIMDLVKDRHYQIACTRHYELTHPQKGDIKIDTIEHPNQYYEMSKKLVNESAAAEGDAMEVDR
ncbi:DNA primase large subunit Spp2 [Fennellomyces sp. T-0311]|nr:DNA primase large subunit Spp2 [Fennellomyces sp. T-0311]